MEAADEENDVSNQVTQGDDSGPLINPKGRDIAYFGSGLRSSKKSTSTMGIDSIKVRESNEALKLNNMESTGSKVTGMGDSMGTK